MASSDDEAEQIGAKVPEARGEVLRRATLEATGRRPTSAKGDDTRRRGEKAERVAAANTPEELRKACHASSWLTLSGAMPTEPNEIAPLYVSARAMHSDAAS